MTEHTPGPELQQSLYTLQQYLSDRIAPLMLTDALDDLLVQPPQFTAAEINKWASAQYRGHGATIPYSDYLYHAVRKLNDLRQYHFVPDEKVRQFVSSLGTFVLELCPEADRETLAKNLEMLQEATPDSASSVEFVHRQAGSETRLASDILTPPSSGSAETEVVFRRFTRLFDQIARAAGDGPQPAVPPPAIQSQLIESAVGVSSSPQELDRYLSRVQEIGVDTQPRRLFEILGQSLPAWAAPFSEQGDPPEPLTGPVGAMHRLVSIAGSKEEGARRYSEMVRAAIDQFNNGNLARAVTMFELAMRIADERHVDPEDVADLRRTANERLDQGRLREQLESKDSHFLLRRVLNFFAPYQVDPLLDELQSEEKRERRRAILALLEVHGAAARAAALDRLKPLLDRKDDEQAQFEARNLTYLLNRIPRGEHADVQEELDLLAALSSTSFRAIVVREAVAVLGNIRSDRSEKILISRLEELEATAISPGSTAYSEVETRQLLDRVTAALARLATPAALDAVVVHGLRKDEKLGDTRGRLAVLSGIDLSSAHSALDRLLEGIRVELPRKLLGLFSHRKAGSLAKLVEALTATTAPAARQLLEEIAARHADSEYGVAARAILDQMGASTATPAPSRAPALSGDLEVLGLPNLLQNIAELELTGTLSLIDAEDQSVSAITMFKGRVERCQHHSLTGKDALFEVFEQSRPGTFTFVSRNVPADTAPPSETWSVPPLILEAFRRHDELNRARLLIPPTTILHATGAKPAPHPEETDPHLVRSVWVKASSGEQPAQWASTIPADSFRIWRLLEHWVETGALKREV